MRECTITNRCYAVRDCYICKAGAIIERRRSNAGNTFRNRDAGQVIGAAKSANVTGCSATNVTVTANGTGTGANINEAIIGRAL